MATPAAPHDASALQHSATVQVQRLRSTAQQRSQGPKPTEQTLSDPLGKAVHASQQAHNRAHKASFRHTVPRATHTQVHAQPSSAKAHPVGRVAIKKVLSTDRAGGQVSALVLLELRQVHAAVALHAVAHISAQTFAQAAQVAEGAVVDVPARLVIEQLADVAVVARHAAVAGPAFPCRAGTQLRWEPGREGHRGTQGGAPGGGLGGSQGAAGRSHDMTQVRIALAKVAQLMINGACKPFISHRQSR